MLNLTKTKSLIAIILLVISISTKAQLTTSNALTPTQLVQTVLLGGGLTATNVTYSGDATAIGSFGGTSNIGFTSGLIMASGDIANAIGPNSSGSSSTNFATTSNDPDLSAVANGTLNDAAILEFDFVPMSDTISFRYVFGSEEYMEFANSSFNDAFGFFITGPNPAGGAYAQHNVALIPGTTTPVTINNVNATVNPTYYFDNENPPGTTVQYDGFTIPLVAKIAVICGQQYHIKLAIADVFDGSWDSGVFIEGGSFQSAGSVDLSASTNFGGTLAGNDSLIYEGCGFASLLITRSSNSDTVAQTMHFALTGTAINGVDYDFVADSVHFAIGQDSSLVVINSLPDVEIEGDETVVLNLFVNSPCGGADTITKTLYIVDSPPLKIQLSDDTALVCPTPNLFLHTQTAGGVAIGGYQYTWTNFPNSTHDTLHIDPQTTTTYIVTVSDSCGNTASDTCVVSFTSYVPMELTLNNDTTICSGQPVFLNANLTNGLPQFNYGWSPSISSADTVTVIPGATSSYTLTITDACGYTVSDTVNIVVYPITADFDYSFATNQTVDFSNQSFGGVNYIWNFGDASDDSVSFDDSPEHYYATDGSYNVTLIAINQNGCVDTSQKTIEIIPDFYFYFPNAFTPNKNGLNEIFYGYGSGVKSFHMKIFDRWGNLIFESNDINTGWDGTYKGKPVERDSYACVFDLESYAGKKVRRIGNVILMR